jgi:tRNA(fMet)-specific endonuclease VapC
MFLLDTNICIYAIKKHPKKVIEKIISHNPDLICTSSIVVSELLYGVQKSSQSAKNLDALTKFLSPMTILPYSYREAEAYGKIRTELEGKGKIIGPYDMMIAAHAISVDAILVTNNPKEFMRVKGLKIENWAM